MSEPIKIPSFVSMGHLKATQVKPGLVHGRYGYVKATTLHGSRLFLSGNEVLACVHQCGLQTFVEVKDVFRIESFTKQLNSNKGFGWRKWTQFYIISIDERKTTFYFAFEREIDAVHFRLLW